MATLRVLDLFDSLQGEGYWTGSPMSFVRLAGCNAPDLGLDCVHWCDTEDAWSSRVGEEVDVEAIVERVKLPRLCLTGGEPLLQLEGIAALLTAAHQRDLRVHLESNGTIEPAFPPEGGKLDFDWVVLSPKGPDYRIAPGWEGLIDELKLVADDSLAAATAERLAEAHPGAFMCIQPVWETAVRLGVRSASAERAMELVMGHPDWRLSLQTHKFLGIR